MPNEYESTQSLRGAEQITVNDLIEATSRSVSRAVKDRENRPEGPLESISIFIGFILE